MAFPNPFALRHYRSGPDGDLIERFLSTYDNQQTRRNYRIDLRQFFGEEDIKSKKASQIREEDIIEFLEERAASFKRTTLERKIEAVRSFFRWLDRQDLIEELPIGESIGTGDLVERILERGAKATEEDGSPSGGFSSREALPSEPPSFGEPTAREQSSGRSRDSDIGSSEEDSPEKDSSEKDPAGDPVVEGGPAGDRPSEKISADENSDEEDPASIPQWALPSGSTPDTNLERGEYVALRDLSDALYDALQKLDKADGLEGIFLRCTDDLAVRIYYRQGRDSPLVEVTIEHRRLEKLGQRTGELSEAPALHQAILYLSGRGWALPRWLYDRVDALPGSADAEGSFSEGRPKWVQEKADNQMVRMALTGEVTGALAQGFGIEKNKDVFLGF